MNRHRQWWQPTVGLQLCRGIGDPKYLLCLSLPCGWETTGCIANYPTCNKCYNALTLRTCDAIQVLHSGDPCPLPPADSLSCSSPVPGFVDVVRRRKPTGCQSIEYCNGCIFVMVSFVIYEMHTWIAALNWFGIKLDCIFSPHQPICYPLPSPLPYLHFLYHSHPDI